MNLVQKGIVAITAFVLVAMLFFPPFKYGAKFGLSGIAKGYAFIGAAPVATHINWALLLLQWGGVIFFAGVLYVVFKDRN